MTTKKELDRQQDYPVSQSYRYTNRGSTSKEPKNPKNEVINDANVEEKIRDQARLFGMTLEEYKEKIIGGNEAKG